MVLNAQCAISSLLSIDLHYIINQYCSKFKFME